MRLSDCCRTPTWPTPTQSPRGVVLTTAQELQQLVQSATQLSLPCQLCSSLSALPGLRRRVLTHVDDVLHAVVDVPLACLQGSGVCLADHRLSEAPLLLIHHEVPRGPLLTPENLALQHILSLPHYAMLSGLGW